MATMTTLTGMGLAEGLDWEDNTGEIVQTANARTVVESAKRTKMPG